MFKLLRNISIIFISLVILLATGGFNVYKHHCNHSDKTDLSVFIEKACTCHVQEIDRSHYSAMTDNKSCCKLNQHKENHKNTHYSSGNCCYTKKVFLKTDIPIIQKITKLNINLVTAFITTLISENNFSDDTFIPVFDLSDTAPPPLFGKNLIYFLNQLKIYTPLL